MCKKNFITPNIYTSLTYSYFVCWTWYAVLSKSSLGIEIRSGKSAKSLN